LSNAGSPDYRRSQDDEFVRLLTQYKSQLFRYIFCTVHNLQDAEDIFQQASITLWDKFSEFTPGTNFFLWACSIARYKALAHLKSKDRQRLYFSEELIAELAENDASQSPALEEARLRALAACREKLSAADQSLLAACYSDGSPVIDVAKRIGRPVGSVYDSLSRIRRALFDCIRRSLAMEGYA
jgi:RNA polymerase sigma-70 factor, ECF subfamily